MMKTLKLFSLIILSMTFILSSCEKDDDMDDMNEATMITVNDQEVAENEITVESVNLPENGWVVVHRDNGSNAPVVPDIISDPVSLSEGESTDITVPINASLSNGEKLWVMLHKDTGTEGEYEFDGQSDVDKPFVDDEGNIVMTPITITTPQATFSVDDQVLSQNEVHVNMTDVPQNGWIVVHRDNGMDGPVVPDIISEPILIEKGESTDISVPLNASLTDGETLWVMLHKDTGTEGEYEFDGNSGVDNPFVDDGGNIVMTPIEISSASITVSDQEVNNNTVTIERVTAARDGWLVVHNDNGSGGIVLPGIIGKVQIEAGVSEDVEITLDDSNTYTSGQKLFPMLHLDTGTLGEYEFDGNSGLDGPEIFSNDDFPGNVIFTSFNVK